MYPCFVWPIHKVRTSGEIICGWNNLYAWHVTDSRSAGSIECWRTGPSDLTLQSFQEPRSGALRWSCKGGVCASIQAFASVTDSRTTISGCEKDILIASLRSINSYYIYLAHTQMLPGYTWKKLIYIFVGVPYRHFTCIQISATSVKLPSSTPPTMLQKLVFVVPTSVIHLNVQHWGQLVLHVNMITLRLGNRCKRTSMVKLASWWNWSSWCNSHELIYQ